MKTSIKHFAAGASAFITLTASAQTNQVLATNILQVTRVDILQALSQTNSALQNASPAVLAAIAAKSQTATATNTMSATALELHGTLPSVQGESVSYSELGVTGRTGTVVRAAVVPEAQIAVQRPDGSIAWVSTEAARNLLSNGEAVSPMNTEVSVNQRMTVSAPNSVRATPRAYSPQIVAGSTALGLSSTTSWKEDFEDPEAESWAYYSSDDLKAASRSSNALSGYHALFLKTGEQVQSPFVPIGSRQNVSCHAYLSGEASIFIEEYNTEKQLIRTHDKSDYQTADYQKCALKFERAPDTAFIRIVISNTGTSELSVDDLLVY